MTEDTFNARDERPKRGQDRNLKTHAVEWEMEMAIVLSRVKKDWDSIST